MAVSCCIGLSDQALVPGMQVCLEAVREREESIKKCKLSFVDEEVLVEVVNESQLGEALTGGKQVPSD